MTLKYIEKTNNNLNKAKEKESDVGNSCKSYSAAAFAPKC